MSGNIAVICAGDLLAVAEAFGEQADHAATQVLLLRLASAEGKATESSHPPPKLRDLEWADGIAFGTPAGDGGPAPELMRFIEATGALWSSGRLYDKAVTVFTDEPEHMAPGSVLHPIYDALYGWGAVIVGPRGFELELEARPGGEVSGDPSVLSAPRLRSVRYRAFRFPLARLTSVLAEDRARRAQLEL